MVAKKSMEASELLAKQGNAKRRSTSQKRGVANEIPSKARASSTKGFAATQAAYGGPSRQKSSTRQLSSAGAYGKSSSATNSHRRNSTAPSAGGKSLQWEPASSTNKKKPAALAVQREKQQRRERLKDAKSSANETDGRRNLDKVSQIRYLC